VTGPIDAFILSIHADIPAFQSPTGYSMPAQPPLWEFVTTDYTAISIIGEELEGWFDPFTGYLKITIRSIFNIIFFCLRNIGSGRKRAPSIG